MWLLGTTSYQFTSLSTVLYAIFMACFHSRRLGMIILGKTYLYRFGALDSLFTPPGLNVYICKLIPKPVEYAYAQAHYRQIVSALAWTPIKANVHGRGQ